MTDGSGNELIFAAPSGMANDVIITFPSNDGNPGEYLTTDGNGNLSFASATIGPDGVNLNGQADGGLVLESSGNAFSSYILPNSGSTESVSFTLPANNGTNGSYLTTDGLGNLVWVDPGAQQDFVVDISTSDPSNQVSVFGGSNSITGSDIYYDASNSFLGIGTSTPGSALDVAGTVNLSSMNT